MDDAVQKVAGYNKNSLFEKIFFGISILIALLRFSNVQRLKFLIREILISHLLTLLNMNLYWTRLKNLNLYFGLTFFFTIVALFVAYFFYAAKREQELMDKQTLLH